MAPAGQWDALVLAAGDIAPVEPFLDASFAKWRHSVDLNFLSQMQFLHSMLPARKLTNKLKPVVLFFAGGGTNSAPIGSSAYTISKIALIKCCEMLDAEIPDTRFTILGPGWVKTKIHQPALDADATNPVHQKTMDMLKGGDFFSMERVVDCCNWLIGSPAELIGGRNFSAVHDQWGQKDLNEKLLKDPNMYKLRRAGNESAVKAKA